MFHQRFSISIKMRTILLMRGPNVVRKIAANMQPVFFQKETEKNQVCTLQWVSIWGILYYWIIKLHTFSRNIQKVKIER